MSLIFQILVCLLVLELVQSLNVISKQGKYQKRKDKESLDGVLGSLINAKLNKIKNDQQSDPTKLAKAKKVLDNLLYDIARRHWKKALRINEPVNVEHAAVVETELKDVISKQSSALLVKPFMEKSGRNDFLVLKPEQSDPFVTVVPNNIYYNIEKKCVNWLDSCSIQGIRARLLEKVRWP